jgi:DNA-directed RNA polymerase specialized sigma24 family protein
MSSAVPFPPRLSRKTLSIFIPEKDPEGRPIASSLRDFVHAQLDQFASYRREQLSDEAEMASLIEEAVYRTSKALSERTIDDPNAYLFRIYTRFVDKAVQNTVKAYGMEPQILADIARANVQTEEQILESLTCEKVVNAMDARGRVLWQKHLLGYSLQEIAADEGHTADYVGQRLRRAMERALRRLKITPPSRS